MYIPLAIPLAISHKHHWDGGLVNMKYTSTIFISFCGFLSFDDVSPNRLPSIECPVVILGQFAAMILGEILRLHSNTLPPLRRSVKQKGPLSKQWAIWALGYLIRKGSQSG